MRREPRALTRSRRFLASAALLVAVGCRGSDTVTGPRRSGVPTPTPRPAVPTPTLPSTSAISGWWVGTFESTSAATRCKSPARATFSAAGNQVTGRLEVVGEPCLFRDVGFEGTLEMTSWNEGSLKGRITGDPFTDGSAQGVLGSEMMEFDFVMLELRDGPNPADGILWLSRAQ
jgi:hypothetical protein